MKNRSLLILLLIIAFSCNNPLKSPQDVLLANLEATGGKENWQTIDFLHQEYTSTTYIGEKAVLTVNKVLKIQYPSTQKEETFNEKEGLEDFTLTKDGKSVKVKYNDNKPFGMSTVPTAEITWKKELELLKQSNELVLIDTIWNEQPVYKLEDKNGESYFYSRKTNFLVANRSRTPYGTSTTSYKEYRRVGNLTFPYTVIQEIPQSGYKLKMNFSGMQVNKSFPNDTFEMIDDSWNIIREGNPIVDFKLPLTDGKTFVQKSDLKDKVVLIDFWATWCKPCISEFPNIKELYQKHKKDGFEVVSISLDENKEILDKFYLKNNLPWINCHLEKGFNSEFAKQMQLIALPKAVLIDGNGTIIAIDQEASGKKLSQKLKELFQSPI